LLLEHLLAVGIVGVRTKVSFSFNFSLHQHLFETVDLSSLVGDLGREIVRQEVVKLLFLLLAPLLQLVVLELYFAAKGLQCPHLCLGESKLVFQVFDICL